MSSHKPYPDTAAMVVQSNQEGSDLMTMQTDAPLHYHHTTSLNRQVYWLTTFLPNGASDVRLDMDQPYQRGHLWGLSRRRNLVRSMLLGVPVASIIVNNRFSAEFHHPGYDRDRNWADAIVDGKQRVTTLLMLLGDELSVPASWFDLEDVATTVDTEDGPYVFYSGLTRPGQRTIDSLSLAVSEGQFPTLADEALVFSLVNEGGIAQGGEKDSDA